MKRDLAYLSFLILSAAFVAHFSFAMDEDTVVSMSAYAGGCPKKDGPGGDNQSRWSSLRPSDYTLDKNSQYAMIAVSKTDGTHGLKGQCFKAVGGITKDKNSQKLIAKIQNTIFVGADECSGCSSKQQVDVSTSCDSGLSKSFEVQSVHLKTVDCPDNIQQAFNLDPGAASGSGGRSPASLSGSAGR
jgi:hypothetical protein